MKIEIGVKDVCLVVGGLAAGLAIAGLGVKKMKKQLRKEFIDDNSKHIKDEVISEIKEEVKKSNIVDEVIDSTKQDIVDEILKESKQDINNIKEEVHKHFKKTAATIKRLEDIIEGIKEEVLNYDARIGSIIKNTALGMMNKDAKRGVEFEIEI